MYLPAAAPPFNLQATQANASAPVEVSWSPPPGGAATITGYRIFYDGRKRVHSYHPLCSMILSLAIKLNLDLGQETKVGQVLSIHAESSTSQLLGDLITVKFSSELYLMLIVLSSS